VYRFAKLYSRIQSATIIKEVWDKLAAIFKDTGLTVNLLRTLTTTQMKKCNSVDEVCERNNYYSSQVE